MAGSNRDRDLDELQRELAPTPHIQAPDDISIRDGMVCWRDHDRMCSGACVAYNPEGVDQGANQCVLLVYQGQIAAAQMQIAASSRQRAVVSPPPPSLDFADPTRGRR